MLHAFTQKNNTKSIQSFLVERCKPLAKYKFEIEFLALRQHVPVLQIKQDRLNDGLYELKTKYPNYASFIDNTMNAQVNSLIEAHSQENIPARMPRDLS